MELTKIQVKIVKDDERIAWGHFCYVPKHIKDKFDLWVNHPNNFPSHYWIGQWAYKQFGVVDTDTEAGLEKLKTAIREHYRDRYPELYLDSQTDKQGWLRVWYTENMEQELKDIGQ